MALSLLLSSHSLKYMSGLGVRCKNDPVQWNKTSSTRLVKHRKLLFLSILCLPRLHRSRGILLHIYPFSLTVHLPNSETRNPHKVRDITNYQSAESRIDDERDEESRVYKQGCELWRRLNYRRAGKRYDVRSKSRNCDNINIHSNDPW